MNIPKFAHKAVKTVKTVKTKRRGRPPSDPLEQETAISRAALALLSEHGYRKTTMLAIAKRANMSKETLYSRFSSKEALFEALIRASAEAMNKDLLAALKQPEVEFEQALVQFGRNLLNLLTSESSVSINRAAIELAPDSTVFSHALLAHGRDQTLPLFVKLIERAIKQGKLREVDKKEAAECFVALLVGDLQHRLLLGFSKRPTEATIERRARQATSYFLTLFRSI